MSNNKLKNKIILVTGGAGFIGSHLCQKLLEKGEKVISLDNYFTGSKNNHIAGVEYRRGHTKNIERYIPEIPDIVYHLGEYSRVAKSIEEPAVVWDLNIIGTLAVVEFCRQRGCKLIYAGSSTKFAETRPDGIEGCDLSPYTWAKAANTELVSNYGKWYSLSYATVYFSNVYGPRELAGEYGTVVEIFKQQYLRGEPLTARAPGTQKRNYTYVDDTVKGLILVGDKGIGDGYNISSEKSYSTMEVAKLFDCKIKILPARTTSRPSTMHDTAKMKQLGWKETKSLAEYIRKFISENPRK
jgi:UDP-glucose 4-epimerase